MHNVKLIIAYDGRAYLGWQKTHMGPSIETTLQQVIEQVVQHPVRLQAASRTDAGVHAQGQVVNFMTTKTNIHLNSFRISLNQLLPKDIVVLAAELVPLAFHPTRHSIGKEYRYFICVGSIQLPCHRLYSWHITSPLKFDLMQQGCAYLIGTHNFAAFCNVRKNARYVDYVRQVQSFEIVRTEEQRFYFRVCGNHFLYKMVRNLVGTLVDIGKEKINLAKLPSILQSQTRLQAGVTAPAHGLFLQHVFYPPLQNFEGNP